MPLRYKGIIYKTEKLLYQVGGILLGVFKNGIWIDGSQKVKYDKYEMYDK